jgi:hypothetical protein
MEEDRTNLVQRCWEQRKNKPAYSKIFKIKEDKRAKFQKSSAAKRSKQRHSKTSQEQRGTNRGVPKLSRSEGEQAKTLQAFQE